MYLDAMHSYAGSYTSLQRKKSGELCPSATAKNSFDRIIKQRILPEHIEDDDLGEDPMEEDAPEEDEDEAEESDDNEVGFCRVRNTKRLILSI